MADAQSMLKSPSFQFFSNVTINFYSCQVSVFSKKLVTVLPKQVVFAILITWLNFMLEEMNEILYEKRVVYVKTYVNIFKRLDNLSC